MNLFFFGMKKPNQFTQISKKPDIFIKLMLLKAGIPLNEINSLQGASSRKRKYLV